MMILMQLSLLHRHTLTHTHFARAPMAQQHKGPFDSVTLMLVATAPMAAATTAATKTFISPYAGGHQSSSQSAFSVGAPSGRPIRSLTHIHLNFLSRNFTSDSFQRQNNQIKNESKNRQVLIFQNPLDQTGLVGCQLQEITSLLNLKAGIISLQKLVAKFCYKFRQKDLMPVCHTLCSVVLIST